MKAQNFSSKVLSKHTVKMWRKNGSDFFLSQGHFKGEGKGQERLEVNRSCPRTHSSNLRPGSKAFTGENNLLVIFLKV